MAKNPYELKEIVLRVKEGQSLYSETPIGTPIDAVMVMRNELASLDRECFCIVNLNTKGKPVNFNISAIGTLDSCPVDIPNVLKACILSNCKRFFVLHNHPGGDTTPSAEDIEVTKRICAAAKLLGLACVDHIIVASGGHYQSIRDIDSTLFTSNYRLVAEESKKARSGRER